MLTTGIRLDRGPLRRLDDMTKKYFAHETACIDDGAEIGEGTKIWHFSHIMPNAQLGNNCNLGQNVVVSPGCVVGNNVKIQNNVSVYTGVVIEDDVFCGPSMVFTNVINPRSRIERKTEYKKTLVKRGATIGANATIVCGNTLGRYCFIGAGAVVTRDVPDHGLVVGNPGKLRGYVCFCGGKLNIDASAKQAPRTECDSCGRCYEMIDSIVMEAAR